MSFMPVLKRLSFRRGLNKKIEKRCIAQNRLVAAKHELVREKQLLKNLPTSKSVPVNKRAFESTRRESKLRRVNNLEGNYVREQVEYNQINRKVNNAKKFRKKPVVSKLRLGQTLANIFLGSNKVTTMTQKMKRVFNVSKPKPKIVVQKQKKSNRLSYPKGVQSNSRGLRR